MKIKIILLIVTLLFCNKVFPQGPLSKQWDKRFGGTNQDFLITSQVTNDNGLILGGSSLSDSSGDKSQPSWGSHDFWIIKLDSNYNKQWDRRYGGFGDDDLFALQQTSDNGYILGGFSNSNASGDKTQDNWDSTLSTFDYWIVKIDSLGNKLWDRRFGGTDNEWFGYGSLFQTSDGGFIVGGYSLSDISGDKTQANWGLTDYWILKIDSLGNKIWDKRFGGTSQEWLYSISLDSDGGYLIGGESSSGISGDKSQASWGGWDYWILKIDSIGNKLWDKRFGGSDTDRLLHIYSNTNDEFLLGGISYSGISGDKTQTSWGSGDIWIIKIDSMGNKIWDKRFGGNLPEELNNIVSTNDGGFLLNCDSYSNTNGDKSENNLGTEQGWIVRIDSLGNKIWDKTVFSYGHDEYARTFLLNNECYLVTISSPAGIGGYKTQPNWDNSNSTHDNWILMFCDSTHLNNTLENYRIKTTIIPNPFNNSINIAVEQYDNIEISISIINTSGQITYNFSEKYFGHYYNKSISLEHLPNGIYFLLITFDSGRIVKKIVKQ